MMPTGRFVNFALTKQRTINTASAVSTSPYQNLLWKNIEGVLLLREMVHFTPTKNNFLHYITCFVEEVDLVVSDEGVAIAM